MGNKIIEEYIKKVASKIIKETIENNNKKVKVEDYWDLNFFTDEMLQHLNVDLSIFLCGKGYGSPIRYRNNKVKVSEQIERTTYPYEEVKNVLERDLHFESWQVIEQQGSNDMKVILLLTDIGKNIDIVISKMKTLGWFNAEMSDVSLYNGIPIIAITFDPMYQSSVNDDVRKLKYLFHVSPAYNKESIVQHGLIPLSQNSAFNYPPRIYLVKPTIPQIVMQDFVGELCYNNTNPKNNGIYSLYQIDVDKIPDNIEFYLDPRFEDGVFVDKSIPNSAIKWLNDFDARNFIRD